MKILLFTVGLIFFMIGIGYLHYPQLIVRLNAFMRETFFKDSAVLLNNKRYGTLLLLIAFILLALVLISRH